MIATRQASESRGIFGSLRHLVDTGLSLVQSRLELIGVELQEERARLMRMLVETAVALVLGTGGGALITAAIVLAFAPNRRPLVLAICGGVYLAGAAILLLHVRKQLRESPPPLSESLLQIKKDREWLESRD